MTLGRSLRRGFPGGEGNVTLAVGEGPRSLEGRGARGPGAGAGAGAGMPLEYAAAAPPSGPVRKPDFRAGSLTKAFAGDFLEEVEPGRGASGARPAQSPVYASRAAGGKGAATDYKGCTTLFETFDRAVREFGDRPALGRRPVGPDGKAGPYEWMTYRKVGEYAAAIGSAMVGLGLKRKDRVGVYGPNCPEWMVVMQAVNRQGMHCVPLYDTLGANAVEFILNHSESKIAFVSADKLPKLVSALPKCPGLKTVVYWGEPGSGEPAAVEGLGIECISLDVAIGRGQQQPQAPMPPKPSDLCTIMYTSGTTGDPKGVMLKHSAVICTVRGLTDYLEGMDWELSEEDVFMSYLPLAHIFDRATEDMFLAAGGAIAYWQGDATKLLDDVGFAKPTLFCGVPRIFDRVYAGVQAKIGASMVGRFLYNWGFGHKLANMKAGKSYKDAAPLFDKIVFGKVAQRLGGRVKIMVSGAAPLSKHVEEFLRVAFCAGFLQGYGLTESCAASFLGVPDDMSFNATVGVATPGVNLRLEAVPDMKYDPHADPPRGEVILKGPALFDGYYKREDLTSEAVDADGWFHTGDVGEIQPNGALKIIDRKKNIFKLSQGEYVAVEYVESVYKKNTLLDMVWVYGNSFESCLVAVVVPNEQMLMAHAKDAGFSGDFTALCQDAKAKQYVLDEIKKTSREGKLKGFEIAKAVHLTHEPFSVDNDLLTPTFKMKRPQLLKHFKAEVDAMYASLK